MEADAVMGVHPAFARPVVALGPTADRERDRDSLVSLEEKRGPRVWRRHAALPGGGGEPDLLVWRLFVDDVGAVVPTDFDGQHAALSIEKSKKRKHDIHYLCNLYGHELVQLIYFYLDCIKFPKTSVCLCASRCVGSLRVRVVTTRRCHGHNE